MKDNIRVFISENTLFTKEAADYLGISVQRLHQLVHSKQIAPIKQSNSGMLFLKEDLDTRKLNNKSIGAQINLNGHQDIMRIDTSTKQEALNYFTIQSFFNNSDKKTMHFFNEKCMGIDLTIPLTENLSLFSKLLNTSEEEIIGEYKKTLKGFELLRQTDYVLKKGEGDYPNKLAITETAPPFLFARGDLSLLKENIVCIVGTRNPSEEGKEKAYRLSQIFGRYGIVVASGLARGIDTQALTAATIHNNCKTIAVIGTSLAKAYPAENKDLQENISNNGLLLSQFAPSEKVQRWFFPMRNAVMSGISLATVVIEAGETSGSLKQADYALKQGRYVFIPQSALDNPYIKWPNKYIQKNGCYAFSKIGDLLSVLTHVNILESEDTHQNSLF